MTPLLLALGVYCNFTVFVLTKLDSQDFDRKNFLDRMVCLHLAGAFYFWIKVSDLALGWSA